jgi:hypothetical protein
MGTIDGRRAEAVGQLPIAAENLLVAKEKHNKWHHVSSFSLLWAFSFGAHSQPRGSTAYSLGHRTLLRGGGDLWRPPPDAAPRIPSAPQLLFTTPCQLDGAAAGG